MERLILKGGGGGVKDLAAGIRTPKRNTSDVSVGVLSSRGSRSGAIESTLSSNVSGRSSMKSTLVAGAGSTVPMERTDTYDDPFDDLTANDDKNHDSADFFLERQRQNSFDLRTDSSDLDAERKVLGGSAITTFSNRPDSLKIPMKRSVSLFTDKSLGRVLSPTAPGTPGVNGDSALLGVQQMLSLLRSQVTKPKHCQQHTRALDDMDTPPITPTSTSSANSKSNRRHSMMPMSSDDFSRALSGDMSTPLPGTSKISPKPVFSSQKTPDAEKAEELALDLKLKNADNKFLQDELNKANIQIMKKDKILSVLTEGLKEVEINQSQLLASRDDLACELEMSRDLIQRVMLENEGLKEELKRLKVFVHMEKTMKQSGTLSHMPSFASFDHHHGDHDFEHGAKKTDSEMG